MPTWMERALGILMDYLPIVVEYAILALASLAVERLGTRKVRKAVGEGKIPPEAGNALLLALRTSILVVACIVALSIGGIPSSWLIGLSALGGTAIGFASTRSIGNLVSGIYIMVSRPFRIGDYVRIGSLEGEVVEITMNYTRLKAPDGSELLLSNQKVLDSNITNYSTEVGGRRLIRYSFSMGFDHSIPSRELEEALRSVLRAVGEGLPEGPSFFLSKCDRGGVEYTFTFYVGDVSELWPTKDRLMRSILRAWEGLRSGT